MVCRPCHELHCVAHTVCHAAHHPCVTLPVTAAAAVAVTIVALLLVPLSCRHCWSCHRLMLLSCALLLVWPLCALVLLLLTCAPPLLSSLHVCACHTHCLSCHRQGHRPS